MALIALFTNKFNLALTSKQFQMTDTSMGVSATANLTGSFRITAPSGNPVYDNIVNFNNSGADIVGATSLNNVTTILGNLNVLPLEQGIYTIYYQIWDSGVSQMANVTLTFNLVYASPTVSIDGTVQVYTPSPLITLTDTTVYQVGTVVPTISRVATISYEPMLINNVLTTPAPTTGTTAVTTSNTFYSPTTELLSVITNLTYNFPASGENSAFTVIDLVSGSQSLVVDATTYCNVVCGLNTMACQVQVNPQNSGLVDDFNLAMSYWTLIMANQNCGNMNLINNLLTQIQALGHFDKDCNCGCEGTFTQVVGLGGLVTAYNVISANSYISVTPSTSGGMTTFTIQLQQAFIDSVNAVITQSAKNLEDISSLANISAFMFTDRIVIESTDSSVTVTTPTNTAQNAVFVTFEGYTNGDIVTLVGGTHTTAATFLVTTAVSIGGQIINYLTPQNAGAYTVIPNNPVTLSGGSGSGTVNVAWLTTYNLVVPPPTFQIQNASSPVTTSATATDLFSGLVAATNAFFEVEFIGVVDAGALDNNSDQECEFYFYDSIDNTVIIGAATLFELDSVTSGVGKFTVSWKQRIATVAGHTYGVAVKTISVPPSGTYVTIINRVFTMKPCV